MTTLWSGLLRTALALKASHVKLATRSYVRDRTSQATGAATSYAIAIGLFGAAGMFLLAACLVGAVALFRWIEVNYGLFYAFGAIGALLLVAAAICAVRAIGSLKRPAARFPSLASRLRVAISANPVLSNQIQPALDAASANGPSVRARRTQRVSRPGPDGRQISAGLILAATMLGWAAARRRQQTKNSQPER
jgi:hypothetical protein